MSGPENQVIEYNARSDSPHWQDPELAQFYVSRGEPQPTQEPVHEGIDQGFLHGLANYSTEPETAPQGHERGLDYSIGEGLGGSAYPIAGGAIGSLLGGAVGSVVPGAGTAVGAVGGGALGTATGAGLYSYLRQHDLHQEQGVPDNFWNTAPRTGLDFGLGLLGPGEGLVAKTALGFGSGLLTEKGIPAFEKHMAGQRVTWDDLRPGWGTALSTALPIVGSATAKIGERLGDRFGPAVTDFAKQNIGKYRNKFFPDDQQTPIMNPENVPATVPGQQPLQGRVIYEESPYVHQGEIVPEGPQALPGQPVTQGSLKQLSGGPGRVPLVTSEQTPQMIPSQTNPQANPNFTMGEAQRNQVLSQGVEAGRQQLDELLNSVSKITERKALKQVLDRIEALRGQMQVNDPLTQRADSILRHYDRSPKR